MKTKIFILSIILSLPVFQVLAQDLTNPGFENWTNQFYYDDPAQYNSSNLFSFFDQGLANAEKTTDAMSGSFGLHLTTIEGLDGPIPGAAFIGQPADGGFSGGIPFSSRPDSLSGFVKFNVQPLDTAYVAVIFKKFGVPLGICFSRFYGSQPDYHYFSQPVDWLFPIISPDSLAVLLISSTIFSPPITGSTITMDNIQFVGGSGLFPNGDFEDWVSFSSEEPDSWLSSNIFTLGTSGISVEKTPDSHAGNWAAKITSNTTIWDDTLGFITNGIMGDNGPEGGMPVNNIPDVLSGYYKYSPVGNDTAIAGMTLYRFNENLGITEILDSAFILLPPVSNYTYFEIPVAYNMWPEPDTVNISFGSGYFDEGQFIGLGSTLWIDDLSITYKPSLVGLDENEMQNPVEVFPNPAHQELFINWQKLHPQKAHLQLVNDQGQIIINRTYQGSTKAQLNIERLSPGIYFYRMECDAKNYSGKFIVE